MSATRTSYAQAIREAFQHLLSNYPRVFVIGQGLWSPWYVGTSMTDLDKEFGTRRIIDSPVSEAAVTGAAIGASMCGYRVVVVHPRMDFMILATDQIVTQAANWGHMFGGQARVAVTIRGIINRGGEQGAQHSQAVHAWYAHVPGLRVVMPATPEDARDLFIAAVLSDDPVLYIDDRWLYEIEAEIPSIVEKDLRLEGPKVLRDGDDCTLVGAGHSTQLCLAAAEDLKHLGINAEVIDLRVLNPLDCSQIVNSIGKTRRLVVVDGAWRNCGLAGEVIAGVVESVEPSLLISSPVRITLPHSPAPTSRALEDIYYTRPEDIVRRVLACCGREECAETGMIA